MPSFVTSTGLSLPQVFPLLRYNFTIVCKNILPKYNSTLFLYYPSHIILYYDGNLLLYFYSNTLHSRVYHICLSIYKYTIVLLYSIKVRVLYYFNNIKIK